MTTAPFWKFLLKKPFVKYSIDTSNSTSTGLATSGSDWEDR
jgi:hypothetical protein